MSGHFEAALDHYRAALKIDPWFDYSQLGLADTYALMGNQAQARMEYDKAILNAYTAADRLSYALESATTWARENNLAEADKAFALVADKARATGFGLTEAEAHRMMSLYQTDDAEALKHRASAEEALTHHTDTISQSDRQDKQARILRYRAVRADHAGNQELAAQTLQQLETMAGSMRTAVVQSSYHGAAGTLLMSKQKIPEAIIHLAEDERQSLLSGIAVTGLIDQPRQRQKARSRSQTAGLQSAHDGTSPGRASGSLPAAGRRISDSNVWCGHSCPPPHTDISQTRGLVTLPV